jgi:hypothetical protein
LCRYTVEHSTPVTAELCQQVIDDTIKVVVDVPEQIKLAANTKSEKVSAAAAAAAASAATASASAASASGDAASGAGVGAGPTDSDGAAAAGPTGFAAAGGAAEDGGAVEDGSSVKVNGAETTKSGGYGAVIDIGDGLDRGRWELVCKDASYVPNPAYCGLELAVTGAGIKSQQGGRKKKSKKTTAAKEGSGGNLGGGVTGVGAAGKQ